MAGSRAVLVTGIRQTGHVMTKVAFRPIRAAGQVNVSANMFAVATAANLNRSMAKTGIDVMTSAAGATAGVAPSRLLISYARAAVVLTV